MCVSCFSLYKLARAPNFLCYPPTHTHVCVQESVTYGRTTYTQTQCCCFLCFPCVLPGVCLSSISWCSLSCCALTSSGRLRRSWTQSGTSSSEELPKWRRYTMICKLIGCDASTASISDHSHLQLYVKAGGGNGPDLG